MNKFVFLMPLFAGIALATQSVINGQLRTALINPYYTALISFIVGTIFCGVVVFLIRQPVPGIQAFSSIAWYKFSGGILGAFVVTAIIISMPKMSTSGLFALIVTGQLLTGFLFDTTGLLNVKISPISIYKITGALLLIIGAYLINKK
jgi:transporter family-2 protein